MVCSTLANIHRDVKKKREPFSPADFVPGQAKPKKQQTPEDMLAAVKMLNAAFGGEVVH